MLPLPVQFIYGGTLMKSLTHYYVGIDIGSETFACSILTNPDNDVYSQDELLNTPSGFEELEEWLAKHNVSSKNSIVCLEATGVYGESLCYWLNSRGYSVAVEPPQKVNRAFNPTTSVKVTMTYSRVFFSYVRGKLCGFLFEPTLLKI